MDLVGRAHELSEIAARLERGHQLITLVGPGGVGKTTLARAAVDAAAGNYPLGVHVVDLGRVDRADAVGGALAAQLGFSSFESLIESPSDQPALVLVDNCEHVLDAASDAVAVVLERCASPTIVATSRSPLGIDGETVIAVPPLAVEPGPLGNAADDNLMSPAVALLVRRSRDAGVELGPDDLAAADELCRRLDGLPLAIEIAAARTRSLTVAQILDLLDTGIDVLARPRFRGDVRHRSLRETIRWSFDLLDPEAQLAFDRLGACSGPFTLDAAAAIALDEPATREEALAVIERLVDASLLTTERTPRGTRYRMLDAVRAGAAEHLADRGETDAVRDRLTSHVAEAVLATLAESADRWDPALLPTMLELFDGVDAAIRHCAAVDDRPGRALLLYGALWATVHQSRSDAVIALGQVLQERWPGWDHPRGPDAAATLCTARLLEGDVALAEQIAEEALADAAGDGVAPITLRRTLALAARSRGDRTRAAALFAEAAELGVANHLPALAMEARTFLAQEMAAEGRTAEALDLVRRVTADAVATRSDINEVWARTVEAEVLRQVGDPTAREVAGAALHRSVAIEYRFGTVSNERTLALAALDRGDVNEARERALHLLDAAGRSAAGDLRLALDVSVAVLRSVDADGWRELEAAARRLPDTNPMSTGARRGAATTADRSTDPRPDIERSAVDGSVLDRGTAIRAARRALADLATPRAPGRAVHEGDPEAVAPSVRTDGPATGPRLVRQGDAWRVEFDGAEALVRHAKGVGDLAVLLERPGHEVHCLDLAGAGVEEASTGEQIDATARRRYEARVRELQATIDDAEADHDLGRADSARIEMDALVDELTAALGLGGRSRSRGDTASRARSAVTHRIRASIGRIGEVHPALGAHLDRSIRTGTWCSYQPDSPVEWTVSRTSAAT